MAKNLDIELALKDEDAKRKAREVGEAAADGMDEAANASDRLGQSLEKSASALQQSSDQLVSAAASMGEANHGAAAAKDAEARAEGMDRAADASERIARNLEKAAAALERASRQLAEDGARGMGDAANASERIERNLGKSAAALDRSSRQLATAAAATGKVNLGAAAKDAKAAAEGMNAAANASERIERNLGKSSGELRLSSQQLAHVAAGMGGMLLGTAAKAVAAYQPQGSTAQKALDWGGSMAQGAGTGAALGSVFGPLGTAIGGLVGAINSLVGKFTDEKTKENAEAEALKRQNESNRELAETLFAAQARTEAFRKTIDSLGDSERPLADRQRELAEEIRRRTEEEARLKTGLRHNSGRDADETDQKLFARQVKDYQANHAELERLQALQKSLAREKPKEPAAAFRESMTAVDALSRVGGAFAGGGDLARDQLRVANDQLAVLKSIDQKTTKTGGETWQ